MGWPRVRDGARRAGAAGRAPEAALNRPEIAGIDGMAPVGPIRVQVPLDAIVGGCGTDLTPTTSSADARNARRIPPNTGPSVSTIAGSDG